MENGVLHGVAVPKMFDDNALEELWGDASIPHTLRIDHQDGARRTDPEARRLAPLYTPRAEQQVLALQEGRQQCIEMPSPPIG